MIVQTIKWDQLEVNVGRRMGLGLLSRRTYAMILMGLLLGLFGSEGNECFFPSIIANVKGR